MFPRVRHFFEFFRPAESPHPFCGRLQQPCSSLLGQPLLVLGIPKRIQQFCDAPVVCTPFRLSVLVDLGHLIAIFATAKSAECPAVLAPKHLLFYFQCYMSDGCSNVAMVRLCFHKLSFGLETSWLLNVLKAIQFRVL